MKKFKTILRLLIHKLEWSHLPVFCLRISIWGLAGLWGASLQGSSEGSHHTDGISWKRTRLRGLVRSRAKIVYLSAFKLVFGV